MVKEELVNYTSSKQMLENKIQKGNKVMKQILKKCSVFIMMGVMAFSLAACGGTKDNTKKQETKVESTASAKKKVENIKKKHTEGKKKIQVPAKDKSQSVQEMCIRDRYYMYMDGSMAAGITTPDGYQAVSYTHLDVYKRQIYDLSSLVFKMSIDELDIQNVKVGQKVSITADAFEDDIFTGTVTNVSLESSYSNGVSTCLLYTSRCV